MARAWGSTVRRLIGVTGVTLAGTLLVACGDGDGSGGTAPPTAADATASSSADTAAAGGAESTTTLKAGAQPGLFDFNQDGTKEPTCGTADFKAGLVVRTYCDDLSGYLGEPARGATLVPGALFSIPGPPDDPRDKPVTEGASVNAVHLQGADGREVVVLTLSSDTVFAVGSDRLQDAALLSLDNIAAGIKTSYPGSALQVRGHTDATGSAASNQSLSERRAKAVADRFASKGLDQARLTSAGLGQTVPNYQEKNADGSDNTIGRDQNRRIEIVIRPA